MSLRCGITTGTCAAAAAKAAALVLTGGSAPSEVELRLPSGSTVRVPILGVRYEPNSPATTASVRKDAGDDPDVTDGLRIEATVSWEETYDVTFVAGQGVGTVTKPGLQIAPGEPAINPVPRQMIATAIREITDRGVRVEISIPGGREIAAKTFNPRLGIEGGLSILGTTGIVRPYSRRAQWDALKCSLDVAAACHVTAPVLVPGNIGARAVCRHFAVSDDQVVPVGNEWGFALHCLRGYAFRAIMIAGHPGKLVKLAMHQWDTHSARSAAAVDEVRRVCEHVLGQAGADVPTVEGVMAALEANERRELGDELAWRIRRAIGSQFFDHQTAEAGGTEATAERYRLDFRCTAVFLVDMAGQCLGTSGDFDVWQM
ncbi:MAG: cobalamin biosynthesis protein CbiD [Planctomycetaceae bacterium]|nr:MAG: cobalamin biosynthesis protein CbiD [Planctomycetaceae bacterium]